MPSELVRQADLVMQLENRGAMMANPTLANYWLALYTRRLPLILVVVFSCSFAYVINRLMPPPYEAKTTFFIAANPGAVAT